MQRSAWKNCGSISLLHEPLLVTASDIVVIALTWHEYTYLRSKRSAA